MWGESRHYGYQTYLSRVENGKANPTISALEVVANALGMTVFDLFNVSHHGDQQGEPADKLQEILQIEQAAFENASRNAHNDPLG